MLKPLIIMAMTGKRQLVILFLLISKTVCVIKMLKDVSTKKPTAQCSTWIHLNVALKSDLANDGISDGDFNNFHCSHTADANPSWWLVDLGSLYVVKQIIYFNSNRNDGAIYNFSVDVFRTDPTLKSNFPHEQGELCYKTEATLGDTTYTWNCSTPVIARYVRFVRFYYSSVSICEIQVMGYLFDPNDGLFVTNENSLLQHLPMYTTTTRSNVECAAECLQPRENQICMGFNWISFTNQCQLMDFSTRKSSLSSLFVYNTDATFTALEQTWTN